MTEKEKITQSTENDNPTEKPGYYKFDEPLEKKKKNKSGFGKGVLVGVLICVAVAIVAVVILNIAIAKSDADGSGEQSYVEKVETIKSYLDKYYIGEYDEQKVTDYIAKGLLAGIDDKYAAYYTKDEYEELLSEVNGNYAGIGVSVFMNSDSEIEIYKVFENTPAKEADLRVGDIIEAVDGTGSFETLDDCVELVQGEAETSVKLTIRRDEESFDVDVERRNIEIQTVTYKMLDGNIGYIQLSEFEKATVDQFNTALEELEKEGAESLILDLRDNPGGDYSSVVSIADRVLPKGTILSTKDKDGNEKTETSDEENKVDLPMVILVNGNSASAAELFTGAVQDFGLATIVGTQTYGKGVVQSVFSLGDGSGMKFTTEKYYTPNGRDIDGVGITPDVVVELNEDAYEDGVLVEEKDNQLQTAISILNGEEVTTSETSSEEESE